MTDRRRWPAIPAVLLLTGLIVLGLSGIRGTPASAVATPAPTSPAAIATPTPRPTSRPSQATSTGAPTPEPTAGPTSKPTPASTASAGPTASFRTYTVKSGDTLSGIASKFGTTSRAIAELNGISVSKTLHTGDVLKIPNT